MDDMVLIPNRRKQVFTASEHSKKEYALKDNTDAAFDLLIDCLCIPSEDTRQLMVAYYIKLLRKRYPAGRRRKIIQTIPEPFRKMVIEKLRDSFA